jgi:hypothetical protein
MTSTFWSIDWHAKAKEMDLDECMKVRTAFDEEIRKKQAQATRKG